MNAAPMQEREGRDRGRGSGDHGSQFPSRMIDMKHSPCVARAARDVGLSLLFAASLLACSSGDGVTISAQPTAASSSADASSETASLDAAIADLHQPRADLYTAGQPPAAAWQSVAAHGITTVINLRPVAEMAGRDEATEVAAAGLAYFEIPVAGPDDITMVNAMALERLIDSAPGPVLVHCASGNRVGALLALGELESRGLAAEQALAFGRSAGLGSLEPRVREVIQSTPVSACQADSSC